MSLCVALKESVRYNEFTIKYLKIEKHEFQPEIEISLLEFVVFLFLFSKSSNDELFIILKFNCEK